MVSFEDHIQWYLTTVKVGLIKQIQAKGLSASGKTITRINVVMEQGSKGTLVIPSYFHTLVDGVGRKPGKMPPIEEIAGWIKLRGLEMSPWAVAKSMAKKGNLIFQRKKEGVDLKGEIEAHHAEFLKRVANALKINLATKYKQITR
jgi:hypothetical protein